MQKPNFKLVAAVLAMMVGAAFAEVNRSSRIGPSNETPTRIADGLVEVHLSSVPTYGLRVCLSALDISSDADYTLDVLDAGTTIYSVSISTETDGKEVQMVRRWDNDDMCSSSGNNLQLHITTATSPAQDSTQKINLTGFRF